MHRRKTEDHDPETHLIPNILLTLTGEKEYIEVFGTDYDLSLIHIFLSKDMAHVVSPHDQPDH